MGLNRILDIAAQLIDHGMDPTLPIAVIDQGTTAGQRVCCARLGTICQQDLWRDFTGPALIIVGEVVNKREKVNLTLLANKGASAKLNLS